MTGGPFLQLNKTENTALLTRAASLIIVYCIFAKQNWMNHRIETHWKTPVSKLAHADILYYILWFISQHISTFRLITKNPLKSHIEENLIWLLKRGYQGLVGAKRG
jgi:hypothetical protein